MTIDEAIWHYETFLRLGYESKEAQELAEISLAALRTKQESEKNDPLTLDELREMAGQPIYVSDFRSWAIVEVDVAGLWAGMPFAHGINFNSDIASRNLQCYRRPPEAK